MICQIFRIFVDKIVKNTMKIGIIVAMDKELRQLRQLFNKGNVRVEKCGIGKVNAALGTARMISEFHPDVIISSGCAGGCNPEGVAPENEIRVQDVVVSSELVYHDVYCGTAVGVTVYGQVQGMPARFSVDPRLLAKATQLKVEDSDLKVHAGLIATGDWFVDSKEKMREIMAHFPEAKAVDMESAAIAHTCLVHRTPFISFRVISDLPLQDTDASMYHNFWDTLADRSFHVTKAFVESLG